MHRQGTCVLKCVCVCVCVVQLTVVQTAFTEGATQLKDAAPSISTLLTNLSTVAGGIQGAINELLRLGSVQVVRPVRACAELVPWMVQSA